MKQLMRSVLLVVLVLQVSNAFAQCPAPPAGPYNIPPLSWYDYTAPRTCYTTSGGPATNVNLWCYSEPAWSIGTTSQATMTYAFTASEDDLDYWDSSMRIEFNDPTNSSSNWVELWAKVTHNGVATSTLLYQFDGADGDLSCARRGGSFNAVTGDSIEIIVKARKTSSTATIEVGRPMIFAYF